jgi:hypothetical protein
VLQYTTASNQGAAPYFLQSPALARKFEAFRLCIKQIRTKNNDKEEGGNSLEKPESHEKTLALGNKPL